MALGDKAGVKKFSYQLATAKKTGTRKLGGLDENQGPARWDGADSAVESKAVKRLLRIKKPQYRIFLQESESADGKQDERRDRAGGDAARTDDKTRCRDSEVMMTGEERSKWDWRDEGEVLPRDELLQTRA